MVSAIRKCVLAGIAFGLAFTAIAAIVLCFLGTWTDTGLSLVILGIIFLVTGLGFALAMAGFATLAREMVFDADSVPAGETLIHHGPANHFKGIEGVGGWLFLTERALHFKSHKINIQRHELTIPLAEIVEAIPARTAGIVPNGLWVTVAAGRCERFVVDKRKDWAARIAAARQALLDREHRQ